MTIFTVTESDVYKKMLDMENLAEARLKAISVLEAQKFDLVQGAFISHSLTNEENGIGSSCMF